MTEISDQHQHAASSNANNALVRQKAGTSSYKMYIPSLLSNRKMTEETRQIRSKSTKSTSQEEIESLLKPLEISKTPDTGLPQVVVVLGFDISNLDPATQFTICAGGTFGFTLLYGTLQELVIVNIAGRKLSFFLAALQFLWFTVWSILLVTVRQHFILQRKESSKQTPRPQESASSRGAVMYYQFMGLALIRALDVTVSNLSMKYLNYPARTLIKSSRVVFTMMLGLVIQNKRYQPWDYFAVVLLVLGLAIFLHADSTSSAVFNPLGVFLLILSLTCDGVINNLSEKMMKQYGLTQDDYHLRLYSLSFIIAMTGAILQQEVGMGIHHFFLVSGTVPEIESDTFGRYPPTWTVPRKMMVFCLLYMTGLFGGSCLGAITRRFGALAMTLTSTTRKAATMFVSFSLFAHNTCTSEHLLGIALYIVSLLLKGYNKATSTTISTTKHQQHRDEKLNVASSISLRSNIDNVNNMDDVEKASSTASAF